MFSSFSFFWEGVKRFVSSFWSVDQVLQFALGCSSSLWRSFWMVVKVSGCFHEFKDVVCCVWSHEECFGVESRFK